MRGLNAPRRRPILVVNFEGDVAGIPTDDQDFAFTTQIRCTQPTFRLCSEQCLQIRKIAFMDSAIIVARVEKGLQFAFR